MTSLIRAALAVVATIALGAAPAAATPVAMPERTATEIVLVHRPGSVQSNVIVGNRTWLPADPRNFAAVLANHVLGGGSDPIYVGAGSRDRNGRSITGSAVLRGTSPLIGAGEPWLRYAGYPFSPWGRWYPWYTGGWGWGYVSYDPWRVGSTRWVWGRYGMWWYSPSPWYDPWYDPWFMYDNFYGSYGQYNYIGGRGSRDDEARPLTGSIRVRVTPEKARVYVDGVLQGLGRPRKLITLSVLAPEKSTEELMLQG